MHFDYLVRAFTKFILQYHLRSLPIDLPRAPMTRLEFLTALTAATMEVALRTRDTSKEESILQADTATVEVNNQSLNRFQPLI
jgi:hypothetical protein